MTPFQRHKRKWNNCKRCLLHKVRNCVVLARGMVPAPILFIGEAPGASEDVIGRPFVGPAGKLLDKMIEQSIDGQVDYCLTNLVACIPKEDGKKLAEPSEECIEACSGRLYELVRMCNPKGIVLVGRLADKHFAVGPRTLDGYTIKRVTSIIHPAAILRMDVSQRGLAVQRCIVALEDVVEEIT